MLSQPSEWHWRTVDEIPKLLGRAALLVAQGKMSEEESLRLATRLATELVDGHSCEAFLRELEVTYGMPNADGNLRAASAGWLLRLLLVVMQAKRIREKPITKLGLEAKVKGKMGKDTMHKEMPMHDMGGKMMPGAKHPGGMPPKNMPPKNMPMKGGKKGK